MAARNAPPILFRKKNAPRPVEEKSFPLCYVVRCADWSPKASFSSALRAAYGGCALYAACGRQRSRRLAWLSKKPLYLTNLVPAFYCKCLREVQQLPSCGGKPRAGHTRPYRASSFGRGGYHPPVQNRCRRKGRILRPKAASSSPPWFFYNLNTKLTQECIFGVLFFDEIQIIILALI